MTPDMVIPAGYCDMYCGESAEANTEYIMHCMMLTMFVGAYQRRLQRGEPNIEGYCLALLDFLTGNAHILWLRMDRFRVRKLEGVEASNYISRGTVGSVAGAITPHSRSRLLQYHSEQMRSRAQALANRTTKPQESKPASNTNAVAGKQ
ncbi:hypothetical protein LPJ73_000163 [Coemansia sp. RSA 2703]|nr:hypothetical protein LPJ73_000163 [Coemansia sp. RSA 2703]KAJ2379494.1 hypothetical protein IW150_000124 [Coemansia sp. RSA 2607]